MNFRGLFSKKVLLAMFYDLKHDLEIAQQNKDVALISEIKNLQKLVMDSLLGDFGLDFSNDTESFFLVNKN